MKSSILLIAFLLALTSCTTQRIGRNPSTTWEQAMSVAVAKARAKEYSYIINNMLAPEFKDKLIKKHGEKNWKKKFTEEQLKQLPYYYGWLKGGKVETKITRTLVQGQFGCYASFIKIDGKYFLCDFGQNVSSM